MDFYRFDFGQMKVAQADAASPEVLALDLVFSLKSGDPPVLQTVTVWVHVLNDPAKTLAQLQADAYRSAQDVLQQVSNLAAQHPFDALRRHSESQVIKGNQQA